MGFFEKVRRCGLRGRYLVMLIMWVIGLLLGLLAPILGFSDAFQFIIVGLGLGALLSWITSGFGRCIPDGSGSPRFRRMHFFNEHPDREALDIKGLKWPPDDPDPPPTIPSVPPQQGASAIALPDQPFFNGVQRMKVHFVMRDPGSPEPPKNYEFLIEIATAEEMQANPALMNRFAESLHIATMPGPGPDAIHVSAILLHGEEEGEPMEPSHFEGVLLPL